LNSRRNKIGEVGRFDATFSNGSLAAGQFTESVKSFVLESKN